MKAKCWYFRQDFFPLYSNSVEDRQITMFGFLKRIAHTIVAGHLSALETLIWPQKTIYLNKWIMLYSIRLLSDIHPTRCHGYLPHPSICASLPCISTKAIKKSMGKRFEGSWDWPKRLLPTQVLTNDKQVTVHTGKEISLNELIIISCHYRSSSCKYMRRIHL